MSKFKIAIICAVALAALAVDFLQFQQIKALRQENEALKQQVAQIVPLQEQLKQAEQERRTRPRLLRKNPRRATW